MPDNTPLSREAGSPSPSMATIPLFPLGPWLWSSMAVVCWLLLVATGLGLLLFFQPSVEGARTSLVELREVSGFDFLRSLHYWASHGLVIAAWLHLMRVFVVGSYRRILGWTATVLLVVVVLAEAWTGSLLPLGGGADPSSLLTLYVLHVVFLPLLTVALVLAWRSQRSQRSQQSQRSRQSRQSRQSKHPDVTTSQDVP